MQNIQNITSLQKIQGKGGIVPFKPSSLSPSGTWDTLTPTAIQARQGDHDGQIPKRVLSFNGSSTYAKVTGVYNIGALPTTNILNLTGVTFGCFFIRTGNLSSYSRLFAHRSGGTDYLILGVNPTQGIDMYYQRSGGVNSTLTIPNILNNTWYYVSVSWDFANSICKIYVNGLLEGTIAINTAGTLSSTQTIIGAQTQDNGATYTAYFFGRMANVTIAERTFTDEEHLELAQGDYVDGHFYPLEDNYVVCNDIGLSPALGSINGGTWTEERKIFKINDNKRNIVLDSNNWTPVLPISTFTQWARGDANVIWVQNAGLAPDGTNTATRVGVGYGTVFDFYRRIGGLVAGQTYNVSFYVKLETATNLNVVLNNTLSWNTMTGEKQYTSADGLNTTTWTRIVHTFVAPSNGLVNIHLGKSGETGMPAQSSGTILIWGLQAEFGSVATPLQVTNSSGTILSDEAPLPKLKNIANARGYTVGTNILQQSENFGASIWTKAGVGQNGGVYNPTLGMVTTTVTENSATNTQHRLAQAFSVLDSDRIITISGRVKRGTGARHFQLGLTTSNTVRIYYNLTNGTVDTIRDPIAGSVLSTTIVPDSTDSSFWFFTATLNTRTTTTNKTLYLAIANNTIVDSETYNGDGTSQLIFSGVQINYGDTVNDYTVATSTANNTLVSLARIGTTKNANGGALDFVGEAKPNLQLVQSNIPSFNGTSSFGEVLSPININQSFSIGAFINFTNQSNRGGIFYRNATSFNGVNIGLASSSGVDCRVGDGVNSASVTIPTQLNTLSFYGITWDATTKTLKAYDKDGIVGISTNTSINTAGLSTGAVYRLMSRSTGEFVSGQMAMFFQAQSVLTDEQITSLKNHQIVSGVEIYPMAEGAGSLAYSRDGINKKVTLTSVSWATQDTYHYNITNGFTLGRNLLAWSEKMNTTNWGAFRLNTGAESTINGINMTEIIASETNSNGGAINTLLSSQLAGTEYSMSVYAKKGTSNYVLLRPSNNADFASRANVWFNLNTGLIEQAGVGGSGFVLLGQSMTDTGNGVYRCSMKFRITANMAVSARFYVPDANNSTAMTIGNSILVGGSQLQLGDLTNYQMTLISANAGAELPYMIDGAYSNPVQPVHNGAETLVTMPVFHEDLSNIDVLYNQTTYASNDVNITTINANSNDEFFVKRDNLGNEKSLYAFDPALTGTELAKMNKYVGL